MITLLSDREVHQLTSYVTEITAAMDNITFIIGGAQTVTWDQPAVTKSVLAPVEAAPVQSQPKTRKSKRHARALLTERKVLDIKRRLAAGERAAIICRDYKVHVTTINAIKYGKTWAHVQLQQVGA
jgi:homoserine kinase